jgi:2-polyprenyl-6-hydroxyphenyl methylase/3-demethylubiquinone-9 3-methyltransferase
LTAQKLKLAESSLAEFVGEDAIKQKSFLDVGCGSGVSSYAAYRLGASRVVSFDVDPECVQCCKLMHSRAGTPGNWEILEGSALDSTFLRRLGGFDVVYSWGVLHHTGAMWQAISNAATLVNPRGYLYLALYNEVEGFFGSRFWWRVKRRYNYSSALERLGIRTVLLYYYSLIRIIVNRGDMSRPSARGMDWWTDIEDWVGGFPYEYAMADEVTAYIARQFPSLQLVRLVKTESTGNNLYLWKRFA